MIRIGGVARESIVDGPGLRFVVFAQGCPHGCKGCHNPETHDPQGGYLVETDKLLTEIKKNPLLKGVTLSGGEPVEQAEELLPLAQAVVEMDKDVVIFSGYTFERLVELGKDRPAIGELLALSSMLIDGPYVEAQRDLTLTFRGSRNQRLLDPAKSLRAGHAVELPL